MATLEQVEKLRQRANVGYAKRRPRSSNKRGLGGSDNLSRNAGKVTPPEGGGYYSSAKNEQEYKKHQANAAKGPRAPRKFKDG